MIELMLWNEEMGGDRRISFEPAEVAWFKVVEKRVTFGGSSECTKVALKSGETFVVTACYDAFQQVLEKAIREQHRTNTDPS